MVCRRRQFTQLTQRVLLFVLVDLMGDTSRIVLSLPALQHYLLAAHLLFKTERGLRRILHRVVHKLTFACDLRQVARCEATDHVLVKL